MANSTVIVTGEIGSAVYGLPGDRPNIIRSIRIDPINDLLKVNPPPPSCINGNTVTVELVDACRLMIGGNLAYNELLWLDDLAHSWEGELLVEHRHLFLSTQLWWQQRQQIRHHAARIPANPDSVNRYHIRVCAAETGRLIRQAQHLADQHRLRIVGDRADIEFCRALAHVAVTQPDLYQETVAHHIDRCDQLISASGLADTAQASPVDQLIRELRFPR